MSYAGGTERSCTSISTFRSRDRPVNYLVPAAAGNAETKATRSSCATTRDGFAIASGNTSSAPPGGPHRSTIAATRSSGFGKTARAMASTRAALVSREKAPAVSRRATGTQEHTRRARCLPSTADRHAAHGREIRRLPRSASSPAFGGDIRDRAAAALRRQSVTYVSRRSPPFCHGDQIDSCLQQSEVLHQRLRAAGVECELRPAGESHASSR